MPRDVQAIRHDLLTALQEIGAFVEGKSLAELQSDRPLQLVLEREFEILGEAFYRLRNAHPELFETIPGGASHHRNAQHHRPWLRQRRLRDPVGCRHP